MQSLGETEQRGWWVLPGEVWRRASWRSCARRTSKSFLSWHTEGGPSRQREHCRKKAGRHGAATVNCSMWQEYTMPGWAALLDKNLMRRTSLVAQWLRIRLPMQGTRVRALVREDPTCCGATKPVCHNYWARALKPTSYNYWARVPQLLKPMCLEPVLHNKDKPPQWEAHTLQRRVAPAHCD